MVRSFRALEGWGVLLGVPALFLLAYLSPLLPGVDRIPLCAVRTFLGVECPGCGLTRSFGALVHGHLRSSIDLHPLGIVIAGWLLYLFSRHALAAVTGKPCGTLLTQVQRDRLLLVFLGAMLLQWIVRVWIV